MKLDVRPGRVVAAEGGTGCGSSQVGIAGMVLDLHMAAAEAAGSAARLAPAAALADAALAGAAGAALDAAGSDTPRAARSRAALPHTPAAPLWLVCPAAAGIAAMAAAGAG